MKANVRFDDIFEGEGFQDIYDQVLEYLQQVVHSGDLDAFDITIDPKSLGMKSK